MNGGDEVFLATWRQKHLTKHEPRAVSPIPEAARQVQQQADDLRKIVQEIQRTTAAREREA